MGDVRVPVRNIRPKETEGGPVVVLDHDPQGIREAAEFGADLVLCGHTHIPLERDLMGLHLMNPGSCMGSRGTYGVIELGEGAPLFRIEENRAGQ